MNRIFKNKFIAVFLLLTISTQALADQHSDFPEAARLAAKISNDPGQQEKLIVVINCATFVVGSALIYFVSSRIHKAYKLYRLSTIEPMRQSYPNPFRVGMPIDSFQTAPAI